MSNFLSMLDTNQMTKAVIKSAVSISSQTITVGMLLKRYVSQQDTLHNHGKLALDQSEHIPDLPINSTGMCKNLEELTYRV